MFDRRGLFSRAFHGAAGLLFGGSVAVPAVAATVSTGVPRATPKSEAAIRGQMIWRLFFELHWAMYKNGRVPTRFHVPRDWNDDVSAFFAAEGGFAAFQDALTRSFPGTEFRWHECDFSLGDCVSRNEYYELMCEHWEKSKRRS